MKRVAVASAALLLLVACGSWEGTGVVVGRRFERAHTEVRQVPQYVSICSGTGSGFHCRQQFVGFSQYIDHVEDRWTLVVQDDEGDMHDVAVDEGTFTATPTGSTFTAGGGS